MASKAIASLVSLSAYSPSRKHDEPEIEGEKKNKDAYDLRTWREHAHCLPDGSAYIPRISFKLAVVEAAKLAKDKIDGKGNQEWGTLFVSGVQVLEDLVLPVKRDALAMVAVSSNANGRPGVGARVTRRFPIVYEWSGDVTFLIANPDITEKKFTEYLTNAGLLIGIGRWRPANRGSNGMFKVTKIKWGLPL